MAVTRFEPLDELYWVKLHEAERPFLYTAGAFAWGDKSSEDPLQKQDAVVVGGEQEGDHKLNVLFEDADSSSIKLLRKAIDLKDQLYIKRFYAPKEPVTRYRALFQVDGLTRYKAKGYEYDRPIYEVKKPDKVWPHFAGRERISTIFPLPERVVDEVEEIHQSVFSLMDGEDPAVLVNVAGAPTMQRTASGFTKEALASSVFRAFVWLVHSMYEHSEHYQNRRHSTIKLEKEPPWHWRDPVR